MAEVSPRINVKAAKIASHSPIMDKTAATLMGRLIAASPRETGDFRHSFHVKSKKSRRGIVDRIVYNDDPNALSIEFGHIAGYGKIGPKRFVPGHHVFAKVLGSWRG